MMGSRRRPTIPRWTAALLLPVQILLWYVAAPASIADMRSGHGWRNGRPSVWNLLGLALLVPGFLWLGWCVYLHLTRSAKRVEVPETAPPYLLTQGPYRWSRNPMYVSGIAIWSGWAAYYGSIPVLAVALLFWSALALVAIPFEERWLEAKWGEAYRRYVRSVPRWFGSVGKRRAGE